MKIRFVIILLFLSSALLFAEDPPKINAGVQPSTVTIGEVVTYKVSVAGKNLKGVEIVPPDEKVFYPKAKKLPAKNQKNKDDKNDPARFVPLYVIQNFKKKDLSQKDLSYFTAVIKLIYYRPGVHNLPDISIKGSDGIAIAYKIPQITVKPLNKDGKFSELESPLHLKGNYTRVILLIIGIVVFVLIAVFVVWYIIKKQRENALFVPEETALELFEKDIKKFKARKYIEDKMLEDYITGISIIFRRYLSRLYMADIMEMTTSEFQGFMRSRMTRIQYEKYSSELISLFNLWDLSKFAEFAPTNEILFDNYNKTIKASRSLHREFADVIS
jgi:hypothetical protein